ncbi:SUN domain-containing protein 2 isoform X3 [Emys orbicularis]|uniref:SUN domain-containing protein 2 isoform X3 n=1 Tax=Emys orbicularis TaxID=82168 RepID=UPI0031FBD8D2
MSRRSQRLGATRYYQGDDDGSSSGGSLLLGGQEPPFRDSPNRTLRRKSSSMKRLSPAPHLGPTPATQTSYYSESVISESYLGSSRGLAVSQGDSVSWTGGELSARRRRRGTGGTESSKINGLAESKTYDTYASSSGYSSEDDYAGRTSLDQNSTGSGFRNAISRAGSFLWLVVTSPGRIFGLLYWWIGTTWYRLTTAASLLDVFVLTSSTQEGLQGSFRQEMGRLEAQLTGLRKELALLASDQQAVVKHVESLPGQIKGVREDVEAQFPRWISQFLSQPGEDGVGSLVLQREELQDQLRKLERKILARVSEDQRVSARDATASIGVALQQEGVTGVTEEQVHLIVNRALKRYSEDRTGMVDYALESGGASVISTRCSETYETKTALLSLFGIPLWYHSQSPRVILQPDVNPGNCWAFRGSQGFAVIRLSSHIHPTAVTLEHVPKALSPLDTIPSAPKDFAIFGLDEEGQQEGIVLGQFTYDQDGDPIQTFRLEGEDVGTFQVVELRILSNWGHPEYTCIYRFRVHGEPVH